MSKALDALISAHRDTYDFFRNLDCDIDDARCINALRAEGYLAISICLYRCDSPDELQQKFAYIAEAPTLGSVIQPHHVEAIIASMAA